MLNRYRGQLYVDIRRWRLRGELWKRGAGVSLRVHDLPWLRHALQIAEEDATAAGLLPGDG